MDRLGIISVAHGEGIVVDKVANWEVFVGSD